MKQLKQLSAYFFLAIILTCLLGATVMRIPGTPITWAESWVLTLDTGNGEGNETAAFRNVVTLSVGGSKVKVTFIAPSSGTWTIDNASIVPRSGTSADGTTTPTELKFGGVSGFSISDGASITSDELTYATSPGDYLISQDVSSTGGVQRYKSAGKLYIGYGKNWYATQNVTGEINAEYTETDAVTKVEVK